jgi:tetratricopeptide (TPR) repeat protein
MRCAMPHPQVFKNSMSTDGSAHECQQLRRDVEVALSGPDPLRVLPLLHRLAARAVTGSDESVFAHRQLAEVLLERDPWRAALHARRVVRMRPDDDRAWAALGLSQSLLGNHVYATRALVRALACAPDNPWYAHNLGHMLDVALDKPHDAVEHLRRAYERSGRNVDVATSLAHALGRTGQLRAARAVLGRAIKQSPTPERKSLLRWLSAGARGHAASLGVVQLLASREAAIGVDEPPTSTQAGRAFRRLVQGALSRGLSRLTLDQAQRAMASKLARDEAARRPPQDERTALALAAAATWTVVASASIPLSQAEVAACFRTSVSSMRQRLPPLRARADAESRKGS